MLVTDPAYWKDQLERAGENLHLATWWAPLRWHKLHGRRHRLILEKYVEDHHSVFEAGCAHGKVLGMLPQSWRGDYLGVDICPEFVEMARMLHPSREFVVGDLRDLSFIDRRFDWAVLCGIKYMFIGHVSVHDWLTVECNAQRVADRILYLEYDVNEEPDYGIPRLSHREFENSLLTDEDRNREDMRDA